jgi:hypothetical protein
MNTEVYNQIIVYQNLAEKSSTIISEENLNIYLINMASP